VTFGGLLRGPTSTADQALVERCRSAAAPGGWAAIFTRQTSPEPNLPGKSWYRPLADATLLLDDAVWAGGAAGFRATNLVLHALGSCCLFLVACRFGVAAPTAFAAAALFASHPMHVSDVARAGARPELLAALLSVGSILLYARAHAARSRRGLGFALAAAAAAQLASDTAAVSIFVLLGVDALGLSRGRGLRRVRARGAWREGWRGTALRLLPFAAVVLIGTGLRLVLPGGTRASAADASLPVREQLLTAGRVLLQAQVVLAGGRSGEDAVVVPPVTHPGSPWFAAGIAVACAGIGAAVFLRRRCPVACFAAIVLLLGLLRASVTAHLDALSGDRLTLASSDVYLPAWGGMLLLALAIERLARRMPRSAPVFMAAVGVLAVIGVARCALASAPWIDEDARITAAARAAPAEPRSHVRLGLLRDRQGRAAEARCAYEEALALAPRSRAAALALARWHARCGDDTAAVHWYERALALEPRSRAARLGLAGALRRLGRLEEAESEHALLAALGAADAEVQVDRGALHLAAGRLRAAGRYFEAATRELPNAAGWVGLGEVHRRSGDPAAAERAFRTAMRLDPGAAAPHRGLGLILAGRAEHRDEASRHLRVAISADPGDAEVLLVLERLEGGAASGSGSFPPPGTAR
jgi:tetratricopeptide (TPR) repeat protein